eukprot:GHVU01098550.1.p2 GENE.GHVU01098550.1~~GHVU01098550.1.p2  ORF type:complete len:209 (+),score=35.15 GHVU01098550.1:372-998(+)
MAPSTPTLNIPSTVEDPNYRYKMPKLAAQKAGRGNGVKTIVLNMGDIAKSLMRPPEYTTKFFGCELGAQAKYEIAEAKAVVNGEHTEGALQLLIDKFIHTYVLCPNCKLPETDLEVNKGLVMGSCNACGHHAVLDNTHKVAKFIVTNPPGGDTTMGKAKYVRTYVCVYVCVHGSLYVGRDVCGCERLLQCACLHACDAQIRGRVGACA